jgi:hypothetical protein
MEKLIIVNAISGTRTPEHIFIANPKLHSSGRRTSRKMFFQDPVLCRVVKEIDSMFEVEILLGNGFIYDRSPSNYQSSTEHFYIPKDMDSTLVVHGEVVNRIYELTKTVDLSTRYIFKDLDGVTVSKDPRRVAIEKMDNGENLIFQFDKDCFRSIDEVIPTLTDKPSILALAKKIATDHKVSIQNASTFIEDDYCDLEFNLLKVDLYRNIKGKLNLKESEYESFQKDLKKLVEKYHTPLTNLDFSVDEKIDLDYFEMDEDQVQTYLIEKNVDISQILEEKRGFINGTKFGL